MSYVNPTPDSELDAERSARSQLAQVPSNQMSDGFHGHVRPRADGFKARCGGPALCKTCQAEQEAREAAKEFVDALLPPEAMARIFGEKP